MNFKCIEDLNDNKEVIEVLERFLLKFFYNFNVVEVFLIMI